MQSQGSFGVIKCANLMLPVSTLSLDDHEKLYDSRVFQAQGSMRIVDRPFAADSCPVSLEQTNIVATLVLT